MNTKAVPSAYVSSYTSSNNGSISLAGLTKEEVDRVQGTMRGAWWMRGDAGRLEFTPSFLPPAAPTEDPMLPQWRTPITEGAPTHYQSELFEPGSRPGQSPSIIIQHLCGYGYTPEGYRANAEVLEACGFFCMRSPRGDTGEFWELWFLPGLWAAKGLLKEALRGKSKEHEMRFALKFLREQTSFGTLDIAIQRLCQILD